MQVQRPAPSPSLPPISLLRASIFGALAVTSVAAYLQHTRLAALAGALVVAGALKEGSMDFSALCHLGAFVALGSMVRLIPEADRLRPYALWAMFAGGYALSRGYVGGFERHLLGAPLRLRADGTLFYPSYNLDKTLAAAILLSCLHVPRMSTQALGTLSVLRTLVAPSLGVVAAMLLPSLLANYVRFDPALPPTLLPWLVHNLALVSIPEETLYRGVLPLALMRSLPSALASPLCVVPLSAVAFGLTHAAGGSTYVALSTLAGIGYSLAALRAGGTAGSLAAHLLLNTVHFTLFTYPALQRG